jgi:hypothetical protein
MSHLDLPTLADYWLGNDTDDAVEEHLLTCTDCSTQLEWVARLAKGVTEVARRGNLAWILTPEFLARLAGDGLRVRTYAPPLNGGVQCTVTLQDDLLMGRLRADLSQVPRLDLLVTGGEGELRYRVEDVAFRPSADAEIVLNQPLEFARAVKKDVMKVKLVSVGPDGERVLGEYTFNHSMPE